MEAQEKAQKRQAQLQLEIRKLEIEADKAMRLCQLKLESQKETQAPSEPAAAGMLHFSTTLSHNSTDVSQQIAQVPTFRETEVDLFFGAFERIASAWRQPHDIWPLM